MARIISSKSKQKPYQKKYDKKELDKKNTKALLSLAKKNVGGGPVVGRHSLKKDDLVKAILARQRGTKSKCPVRSYECKRTGALDTPVRTDKGGCRYCKLHPKRKVGKPKGRTACKDYKIYQDHISEKKKFTCKPLRNPPTRDNKTNRCSFCQKQRVRKQKAKKPAAKKRAAKDTTSRMSHGAASLSSAEMLAEFDF